MGNKVDVEDYEVLDFLLKDEKTSVVGMYVEGVKNGRALFEVARNASKPIVVFKTGRTEYGKRAALSHTASMAGDDDVFDAFCRQANIVRVYSFEEMFNVTKAFSMQPLPEGDNVAVVHYTGSGCVQAADAAYFASLKLAELSEDSVKRLESVNPEWHRVANPVDIWPAVGEVGTQRAYDTAIETLLSDENVDALVVALWASSSLREPYQPDFRKLGDLGKPVYFVVEGPRDATFEMELCGFPTYPDVITALNVLGKVVNYAKRKSGRN